MPESFKTKLARLQFRLFPAYRGTGGLISYIADNWQEIKVEIPLNWRTRNYVGTIYGGSMYGAVDPIYMLMLIKILGPDYIVWDKAAFIKFIKPGRSRLYATFRFDTPEIEMIKAELERLPKMERIYHADIVDQNGIIHASVDKTLYIRKKTDDERKKSE
jgi:hypothetical protein